MWQPPTLPDPDERARSGCAERLAALAKPAGALGRLEALACWLAAVQGRARPTVEHPAVLIFAGDHGVCAQGVSPYPSAVTAAMCAAFAQGGAAVNVLARQAGAAVSVVDVAVAADLSAVPGIVGAKVLSGTADFTRKPAMSDGQCCAALMVGADQAARAVATGCDCLCPGEMGIGNTTSAAALLAAVTGAEASACVGRGTGIDDAGLARKAVAVTAGLERHRDRLGDPFATLAALGGAEIAAMTGAMLAAAAARVPVVVDGFIASAAALMAVRLQPSLRPFLVFAHRGAEAGHARLLAAMDAEPLLNLELRLGEGTGAVLAIHLLRAACRCCDEMATLEAVLGGD